MPKQEENPKKGEATPPADPIAVMIAAILQADRNAEVLAHDENWVDVSLSPKASVERVVRALRGLVEEFTEQAGKKSHRKVLRAEMQESLVSRLSDKSKTGVTLCLLEGPKLFVDAVPLALKVALRDFAVAVTGVPAAAATMTRGVCADLRAAPDYVANR